MRGRSEAVGQVAAYLFPSYRRMGGCSCRERRSSGRSHAQPSPHSPPRPRRNCQAGSPASSHIAAGIGKRGTQALSLPSAGLPWPDHSNFKDSVFRFTQWAPLCLTVVSAALGVTPPLATRQQCPLPQPSYLLPFSLTVCFPHRSLLHE